MDAEAEVRSLAVSSFEWGELRWLTSREEIESRHLALAICELKAGKVIPDHYHLGVEQILYIASGCGSHTVNGSKYLLFPGSAVRLDSDIRHAMLNHGDGSFVFLTLYFPKDGKVIDSLLQSMGIADQNQETRTGRSDLVKRVTEYISSNLNKDITLEKIASVLYVSPFYLSRRFRHETGITFKEYLVERRIQEAVRLLTTTGMSIENVASSVGFRYSNYFAKVFKKITGYTPESYRRFHKMTN
ncbi:MAG TPA: helix-turn-helix domain-containing protein [Firmicutes bacterium]|nr:helix-turn-helix domain-containing protein [Candidatus Fermentithermobacillaceae bacterium]